ncbi:MAG TPA: MFS transporter [Friedmanniella sp.]
MSSEGTPADRRNARLYLAGLSVSLLGDSALSLVAGIWVKQLTGSSALAGLTQACIYLPSLLGPLAGLLADRFPRQRLIVAVNLATSVLVGSLLLVPGIAGWWLIHVVMLGYGTALVLVDPAETALFTQMLPLPLRRRVNGLRLGLQETGRLVSPLIGAGLFVVIGGAAVAALDAATFVVAAVTTSLLRVPPEGPRPPRGVWASEVGAGFRQLRSSKPLRVVVAAATAIMAVSGVGVAAQYSLVAALGRPPAFLGVLAALLGGGSVVASLVSGPVLRRLGPVATVVAGLVAYALGTTLRAVPDVRLVVLGSVVLGFALPWVFLAALTAVQELTPDHLQGRTSAAVTLLLFGPQAPVQALGSLLIAHLGYQAIYLGSAAAAVAILAAVLVARRQVSAA